MRIASSQYQATMTQSIELNQSAINTLTEQMASGQRIMLPSDDPVGSVRLSRLQREESDVSQYRANIAAVQQRLTTNEGYLSNMVNDITAGRDLLVGARDGSNTSADLNAKVSSLQALRDSLMYSANTQDSEGHYIFSGTASNTPAITYNAAAALGSRYTYTGNTNNQNVVVGNGLTQVANQNVQGLDQLLNQIDQTIATISAPNVDVNNPAVQTILKTNLDGFDSALNLISGKVAVIGGSQNILTTLDSNLSSVSLSNQTAMTNIGSLDYAKAATEQSGYTLALQSTYKAYGKISQLSLFNAL